MSWQPHKYGQPAPPYGAPPQPVAPARLKRQASELKSVYPTTKWCACYINTANDASGDYVDDNVDVTTKIEQTNVYIPMDLEETAIAEIEAYTAEEKDEQMKLASSLVDAEKEKIETFMSFTGLTDADQARAMLVKAGWDLQKATTEQFSSPSVKTQAEDKTFGAAAAAASATPQATVGSSEKSIIRLILPDSRNFTYQMDSNDTFWGVYGRLLQSVPELASKAFSLELGNGHVLNENEFDQTLSQAQLIPRGDIRIKY